MNEAQKHLLPGTIWTLGTTGNDNSWMSEVWEVVVLNGPTVWLKCVWGSGYVGNVISVNHTKRNFYPAEHVLQELRDADPIAAERDLKKLSACLTK